MKKRLNDHELAEKLAARLTETPSGGHGPAADARILLQHAASAGEGPVRQQYLAQAQREIAKLNPARHRTVIHQLQSQVLAVQGRGGDTRIAHVTPGEVVIPVRLQSPEFMAAFAQLARAHGIDPAEFQVGNERNKVNPQTGQLEFQDEYLPNPSQPDNDQIYRDANSNIVEGIDVETPRDPTAWEMAQHPINTAAKWISTQAAPYENERRRQREEEARRRGDITATFFAR
jgi:hypothetical protein